MMNSVLMSFLFHFTSTTCAYLILPSTQQRSTIKNNPKWINRNTLYTEKQSKSFVNSLCMTNESNQDNTSTSDDILKELDLDNTFSRWVFLKNVLDTDENDKELKDKISIVTYKLIESFVIYPLSQRYQDFEPTAEFSVEMMFPTIADHLQTDILDRWVLTYKDNGRIPLFKEDGSSHHVWDYELIMKLDLLLPLEYEDKDAYDGLWDTVKELHGEEMVKIHIQEGDLDWDARCIIARFFVHYNFLRDGIIMKSTPFE